MKKLLATLVLALNAVSLHAAITAGNPAFDPFANATGSGGTSYNVGDNLINEVNAQGLTWFSAGPTGTQPQPVIVAGNLSVSGLVPSTGNSVSFGHASGDFARLGLGGSLSSGTVYYSMAMKVTSLTGLTTGGAFVAAFNNSSGSQTTQPAVLYTRAYVRLSGTSQYNIGMDKSASGTQWDTGLYNVGDTVFLVGSYTFNNGSSIDDVSSFWINPVSSTFGAASAPAPTLSTSAGSDITSSVIGSFILRVGSTVQPTVTVDDVRVGLTWADVTPPVKVAPAFSNLAVSQSAAYGTSSVTVSGTVSASGPVYPASGEPVVVTINGKAQTNTFSDGFGDFSFSYNPSTIPASGTPYTITYSYAGDVFLTSASDASTTLTITPLPVALSGSRTYDGTATAASGILSVANAVGSDNITVASGSATLSGANAGAETITSTGTLSLGGTAAGNYTLSGASGSVTVNPLPVVLTGTRAYDGTSTASYTILSIANKVGSDNVTLTSGSATLAGSGAGAEAITSPGTLTLGGTAAGNYTLTGASGSVSVTGGTIVVVLSGTRPYNGTTAASYTVLSIANKNPGDNVSLVSGTATLAGATPGSESVTSVGTLVLGGAQASNYTLSGASGSVTITPLPVILAGARTYDGTTNISYTSLSITNAIGGDDVTLASGSAILAASNVGPEAIASPGTLALGGTTAGDYTLTGASGSVTISPLPVVLTGKRGYDGTATASSGILSVANKVGSDDVSVASGSGTLAGASLGTEAITSFGSLALGGTTAGDYTLTGASGSVLITFTNGAAVYDPFADASASGGSAYSIGANLAGQTNSQGLTWYSAGPAGNQPQPVIASGNLSVTGLTPSTGNSVSYGNGNGDGARLGLGGSISNGTLYYSMSVEVTSLGGLTTAGAVMAGFNNSSGSQLNVPTVIAARLEMRLSGTSYNIGLDKSGTGIVWDSGMHNAGETVFVVGSYTFNTGGTTDDTTSLWINPAPSTFDAASAPAPTLTSSTGSDITAGQIASFLLREGSTIEPPTIVDDLRVGYTWADVTPNGSTPPFSITSQSVDNTGTNLILSWASTVGATYQVIGSTNAAAPLNTWTNVGSPITATGISTSITNPTAPPLNFYKVVSP